MEKISELFSNSTQEQIYELAALDELSYTQERQQQSARFFLDYVHFPLMLNLIETKENNDNIHQQIEDGLLSFILDFCSVECRCDVSTITVLISNATAGKNSSRTLRVPLVNISLIQKSKIFVNVDLNSIIDSGKRWFDLGRNLQDTFHLVISAELNDGSTLNQHTRPFTVVKSRLNGIRKYPVENSNSHLDSLGQPLVGRHSSPRVPVSDTDFDTDLAEARTVVAEHITARVAEVSGKNLFVGKTICSANGDIAYHFALQHDDDDVFEEGEVVGFCSTGEEGEKERFKICKLTLELSSLAILKGVVSRSQYLEAQKPDPGTHTETVAMLGIVPVQVVGGVCANEALYVSPTHPGCAVSGSALDSLSLNETAFIGYAFDSRKTNDNQSLGMVQAAVFVLQSAGLKLHADRIRRLQQRVHERIGTIRKFGKNTRRYIGIGTFVFILLLALGGILAWQLAEPGTAMQYWLCEAGRKIPYSQAKYSFISLTSRHSVHIVNGIEFEFSQLMKKANHKYQKLGIEDERYYLNIDRCAHGQITKGDILRGIKRVKGPTVFAVDEKCFNAYYYSETKSRWRRYNSVSWMRRKNICCEPRSKLKNCTELRKSDLCNGSSAGDD